MPLPLLLLISSVTEVISPDDLLLFAKGAAVILTAQLPLQEEIACSIGFSIAATTHAAGSVSGGVDRTPSGFFRYCNAAKPPCCAGENWWWAASVSGWGLLSRLAGGQRPDALLIHPGSRVVSNSRCQAARRSGDVSPPSNQTPVRARDTAT